MSNLSETQIPNGGWQWFEAKTKFTLDRRSKPSSVSVTLDQAAELVQKHRMLNAQLNLPTGFYDIRSEILEFNRKRLGIPPPSAAPKAQPVQQRGAAAVAGHVGKTAAGIRLVIDWLGEGLTPVERSLAETRAKVCVQCPQNQVDDLWQRLDAKAAEGLRRLMSVKNDMELKTTVDHQLKTCLVCDCYLPLKVHARLDHILKNTPDDVLKQLNPENPQCWIISEAMK